MRQVDGTEVGSYQYDQLAPSFDVGYILSESAFGEPEGNGPVADQDFAGC